jgi:hypothetical protein
VVVTGAAVPVSKARGALSAQTSYARFRILIVSSAAGATLDCRTAQLLKIDLDGGCPDSAELECWWLSGSTHTCQQRLLNDGQFIHSGLDIAACRVRRPALWVLSATPGLLRCRLQRGSTGRVSNMEGPGAGRIADGVTVGSGGGTVLARGDWLRLGQCGDPR